LTSLAQRIVPARIYYGWVIVVGAVLINVAGALLNGSTFSFFLGPMTEDLGVGKSALSWGFTLRLFAAGLSGPLLGVMLDRYGARWPGVACGLLAGGSLIILSFANNLWMVYAAFVLSGTAGFGSPAGQLLTQVPLARWFVAKRGMVLAIATSGVAGGAVVAIAVTELLIGEYGWRTTNLVYGLFILAVMLPVCAIFYRRAPEDLGLKALGSEAGATAKQMRHMTTENWTVGEALRAPVLWLVLLGVTLGSTIVTATVVHRVDYWKDTGMSAGLVASGTAIDPLVVLFSAFAAGVLADRFPIRYIGFFGLTLMGISVIPLAITDGETWTIFAHGVIWGVGAGSYLTLNSIVWPNYFGTRYAGSIRGIALPIIIVGSGVGPPLFGFLFDQGVNPRLIWGGSTACMMVAALLVLVARPPRRRSRAAAGHHVQEPTASHGLGATASAD